MFTKAFMAATTVAALAVPATGALAAPDKDSVEAITGIPGPRTCFWSRGPVSADPYINIAYPDSNVFYWSATFTVPEGAKLQLEGNFPHSRYMSFISYDGRGRPIESLADYLISPNPGATNPFRSGSDRDAIKRGYTVDISDGDPVNGISDGIEQPGAQRQVLHAPKYGPGQQQVLYRIYANDTAHPVTGGEALPEPVLTLKNGKVLRGAEVCGALNASQFPMLDIGALGIPVAQYRKLVNQPGKPDTWPAQPKPEWHIQLDRQSLIGIYTGEIDPNAKRTQGGFYPNPDNNYIRTIVNLRFGPVIVMRGKAPTTPRTQSGEAKMARAQLRYWSICSNQSFANTRVNGCLDDEQIPVDKNGYYTVVISKAKDRPRNARPECGIGWLPVADDGDGVSDSDVAVVQIRHMLADPGFAQAIQRIPTDDQIDKVMGPYAPKMRYLMPSVVETLFPCLPSK
ncbi:hypothetical protein [Tsuneonella mangrovi]|uniref:hypothetical protein n=1 Tax=Tsuneonella mangrovi TaxID=1982042 RepID=UPI0012375807|nr:hypothetical protein [Tsuneonella mangrovi]